MKIVEIEEPVVDPVTGLFSFLFFFLFFIKKKKKKKVLFIL